MEGTQSLGTTYTNFKWILIGAKTSDGHNQEQIIKGVIAHEMCHYVMKLIYQNNENPYYEGDEINLTEFDAIVTECNRWKEGEQETDQDDECDGIISSVFKLYPAIDFHAELIVRPINIYAQFSNNIDKIKTIEDKHSRLFYFYEFIVVPEIVKFNLKHRKNVQKVNYNAGVLDEIRNLDYKIVNTENLSDTFKHNLIIITTNAPKIFLLNIVNELIDKANKFVDIRNIFISSDDIKNNEIMNDLTEILKPDSKLKVFVNFYDNFEDEDITKLINIILGNKDWVDRRKISHKDRNNTKSSNNIDEKFENYNQISIKNDFFTKLDTNFTFIVSTDKSANKLLNLFQQNGLISVMRSVKYGLSDLSVENQNMLLETKVQFQKSLDFPLLDLLSIQENNQVSLEEINDDQLLNCLIERHKICINAGQCDEGNEKDFELLFSARNFVKIEKPLKHFKIRNEQKIEMSIISQEQLLEDVENKRFILFSDIAGAGKTWAFKNITNILKDKYPNKWITYVDLKQFINSFESENEEPIFLKFITQVILKEKSNLEKEIFKKLYENGRICILFDGFDEIAPDCAHFVSKLAKIFQYNDGNQLWIATREYFEIDLQQLLNVDVLYKLQPLSVDNSINIVSSIWILSQNKYIKSTEELKSSENYEKLQKVAKVLTQNFPGSQTRLLGIPQFFKMFAEVLKIENVHNLNDILELFSTNGNKHGQPGIHDDSQEYSQILKTLSMTKHKQDSKPTITLLWIFSEFVNLQYERWAYEKGDLRKKANIEVLNKLMDFQEVHQVIAMKGLFPGESSFHGFKINKCEWPDEEIIACGFVIKRGEHFQFNHETYREYFAAEFIVRTLLKGGRGVEEDFCKYLIKFLTVRKFEIIREFLNEAFGTRKVSKKILEKMPAISRFFYKYSDELINLSDIFEEKFENIVDFVVALFKNGTVDEFTKILKYNKLILISAMKQDKIFLKFQTFIDSMDTNSLKIFVKDELIVHKLVESELRVEIIKNFLETLKSKTDINWMKEVLCLRDENLSNIFSYIFNPNNFSILKFETIFKIINNVLKTEEMFELMRNCDNNGWTIVHLVVHKYDENILNLLKNHFYSLYNLKHLYLQQSTDKSYNPLHLAAFCDQLKYHETFWSHLLNIFGNPEELINLILQKSKNNNNCIHLLIIEKKAEILKLVLNLLKEQLCVDHFRKILKTKGYFQRNIIQITAKFSDVITHQILYKIIQNSFNSDEFLEFFNEADQNGRKALNVASSGEILEFMICELEKVVERKQIRSFLCNMNVYRRNILQCFAFDNKSLSAHKSLWKILENYFTSSEIFEFIAHFDVYDVNYLYTIAEKKSNDVIRFIWDKIKDLIINSFINVNSNNASCIDETKLMIKRCDKVVNDILQSVTLADSKKDILKLYWIDQQLIQSKLIKNEVENHPRLFSNDNILTIGSVSKFDDLLPFIADKSIENHENLWNILLTKFTNREDLKKLLSEVDFNENNYIHLLIKYNHIDVIEFTLKTLKNNLNDSQYKEMLKLKGYSGMNILQRSCTKTNRINKFVWKMVQESCESNEEFYQILSEVNDNCENIFHIAISSTKENFELMLKELKKIVSIEKIRKLLTSLNGENKNILQIMALKNNSISFHKYFWKLIAKHFNNYEIMHFIKNIDVYGENTLLCSIKNKNKDVIILTWTKVQDIINKFELNDDIRFNLRKCAQVLDDINKLIKVKKERKEILKLFWIRESKIQNNVEISSSEQKLSTQISKFENLLKYISNTSIKTHEALWLNLLAHEIDLNDLMTQTDSNKSSYIFHLITYNNAEVIKFTLNKLRENLSEIQYNKILRSKRSQECNLFHHASFLPCDIQFYKFLWKTIQKSCKSNKEMLEILDEVNNNSINGFNALVCYQSGEIFEFSINETEKIASIIEIRKLMTNLNLFKRNLLQSAAFQNNDLSLHKSLWRILAKYFNVQEMLEFVRHLDVFKQNFLISLIERSSEEIILFSWSKVKKIILENLFLGLDAEAQLRNCENIIKDFVEYGKIDSNKNQILQLKWLDGSLSGKLFDDHCRLFLERKILIEKLDDLIAFCTNENIKDHNILWEILKNQYSNPERLYKLMMEKDSHNMNYIHQLASNENHKIVKLTLKNLKENTTDVQYSEILQTKGFKNKNLLHSTVKNVKMFRIFWNEFKKNFKLNAELIEVLEELEHQNSTVLHVAIYGSSLDVVSYMIDELKTIAGRDDMRKMLSNLNLYKRNMLQSVCYLNKNLELLKFLWNLFETYFNSLEMLEFIKHLDDRDKNLLIIATQSSKDILEFTWNKVKMNLIENKFVKNKKLEKCNEIIENILNSVIIDVNDIKILNLSFVKIKESSSLKILENNSNLEQKILINTSKDLLPFISESSVEKHEALWNYLTEIFDNREELMMLLKDEVSDRNNYLHSIIRINKPEIIKFTIRKCEEILENDEFLDLLRLKGKSNSSLLHLAAIYLKNVNVHKVLWKILQKSFSSEQFVQILIEIDDDSSIFLDKICAFSADDVLEFVSEELEKIESQEVVKKLLTSISKFKRNLLQTAAYQNFSIKLHENLWKLLEKYFNSMELIEFAKALDTGDRSLLLNVVESNTNEVICCTWNKVKYHLTLNSYDNEQIIANIAKCDEILSTKLKVINKNKFVGEFEREILKLKWINSPKIFDDHCRLFLEGKIPVKNFKDIYLYLTESSIKFHELLWKNLIDYHETTEEIKNLMLKKDINGDNYLHLILIHNNFEIFKLTMEMLRKVLNDTQFHEILTSKGARNENTINRAVSAQENVQVHKFLWAATKASCKSNEEFLKILKEVSVQHVNVFDITACCSSGEIFRFIIEELEKVASLNQIREILCHNCNWERNILQSAAFQNKNLSLHECLWVVLEKYFNLSEILEFIVHIDLDSCNFLQRLTANTNDIISFGWNKVKKYLSEINAGSTKIEEVEEVMKNILEFGYKNTKNKKVLNLKWIENISIKLFSHAAMYPLKKSVTVKDSLDLMQYTTDKNIKNHEILWRYLTDTYYDRQDIIKLITKVNYLNNYFHNLLEYNNADIIILTFEILHELLSNEDYRKLLKIPADSGKNTFQKLLSTFSNVKIHKVFWKIFKKSCKSDDEFTTAFEEVNTYGNNLLQILVIYRNHEIISIVFEELKKCDSHEKIKKLILNLNKIHHNLLQCAAVNNKDLKLHQMLWEFIKKYLNISELLNLIKNLNKKSKNLLECVIQNGNKEVIKFTYDEIKKVIIENSQNEKEIISNIEKCDNHIKNILESNVDQNENIEIFKLTWITFMS